MAAAVCCLSRPAAASPFADLVVQYAPGTNPAEGFTDPLAVLGEPTRLTNPDHDFGGAVTPFNASWGPSETVSIGEGGSLTVQFAQPVVDDARNPFGIDLLVFGNSFLALGGGVAGEGGLIEVSADGVDFFAVPGVDADGIFPTLGYQDLTEPFPSTAGSVLTNFTRPVDPSLDLTGLDMLAMTAAYDGSGGGAGVDLSSVGLAEISFVRISNPAGSGSSPEIDALADVSPIPEPTGITLTAVACLLAAGALRRQQVLQQRLDQGARGRN